MNSETALSILLCAIYNVNPAYIYYGESWDKSQVERCFAYELYHQWRRLIDIYIESHPKRENIYLNGEIPKSVGGRECLYPDLVLHSGQDNEKRQILACEIKRADNKEAFAICRDIYKLLKYLDFYKGGNQNIHVEYEDAIFIMVGCSLSQMESIITEVINKSIDDFPTDKQSDIKKYQEMIKDSSDLNRVICIAIDRYIENSIANLKVESCSLDKILTHNKKIINEK